MSHHPKMKKDPGLTSPKKDGRMGTLGHNKGSKSVLNSMLRRSGSVDKDIDVGRLPVEKTLALLQEERDKLAKLEDKMRESEAVTDEMEMEHDEQCKRVSDLEEQCAVIASEGEVLPDSSRSDTEDPGTDVDGKSKRASGLSTKTMTPVRKGSFVDPSAAARSRPPQIQNLVANGYDADLFRHIYSMGFLKWEFEPGKWTQVVAVLNEQHELHLIEEAMARVDMQKDLKRQSGIKKMPKRKPLMTIQIGGSKAMIVMSDQTKFTVLERKCMNTNHYGDGQYRLESGHMTQHNFQSDSRETSLLWIEKLGQALALGDRSQEMVRVVHCLYVTVKTAALQRKEKNAEYCCRIYLDTQEEGRTQWTKPSRQGEINWMEQFAFDDIPTDTKSVTFVVLRKSLTALPMSRIKETGRVTIPAQTLRRMEKKTIGVWYDFDDQSGKLMIEPNFTFQKIYPLSEYAALRSLLNTLVNAPPEAALAQVQVMSDALTKTQVQAKAHVGIGLTRYFMTEGQHIKILQYLGMVEVNQTEDPFTLFRGNSICSKALDFYMNYVGNEYLRDTIGPFVQRICHSEQPCEVDPTRLGKNDNLQKNWERLYKLVGQVCSDIFNSADQCPVELRRIFHCIRTHAEQRFGLGPKPRAERLDSKTMPAPQPTPTPTEGGEGIAQGQKPEPNVLQAVSGFIFLRFFSAALVSPSMRPFNLVKDIPSEEAKRTLTILSKVLTKLANLALFTQNESHLMPLNQYMEKESLFQQMKIYLLKVSVVKQAETEALEYGYSMDTSRVLSHVHRLFTNLYLEGHTATFVKDVMDTVHWDQMVRREADESLPSPHNENTHHHTVSTPSSSSRTQQATEGKDTHVTASTSENHESGDENTVHVDGDGTRTAVVSEREQMGEGKEERGEGVVSKDDVGVDAGATRADEVSNAGLASAAACDVQVATPVPTTSYPQPEPTPFAMHEKEDTEEAKPPSGTEEDTLVSSFSKSPTSPTPAFIPGSPSFLSSSSRGSPTAAAASIAGISANTKPKTPSSPLVPMVSPASSEKLEKSEKYEKYEKPVLNSMPAASPAPVSIPTPIPKPQAQPQMRKADLQKAFNQMDELFNFTNDIMDDEFWTGNNPGGDNGTEFQSFSSMSNPTVIGQGVHGHGGAYLGSGFSFGKSPSSAGFSSSNSGNNDVLTHFSSSPVQLDGNWEGLDELEMAISKLDFGPYDDEEDVDTMGGGGGNMSTGEEDTEGEDEGNINFGGGGPTSPGLSKRPSSPHVPYVGSTTSQSTGSAPNSPPPGRPSSTGSTPQTPCSPQQKTTTLPTNTRPGSPGVSGVDGNSKAQGGGKWKREDLVLKKVAELKKILIEMGGDPETCVEKKDIMDAILRGC